METEGDMTLGGEHTTKHTDNVLYYRIFINIFIYKSFKEEMIKCIWMRTSERSTLESLKNP